MSKRTICYPYGMGVSCICDSRGRIYKCFSSTEFHDRLGGGGDQGGDHDLLGGEAVLSRDDRAGHDGPGGLLGDDGLLDLDGENLVGRRRRNGLDERTEIILAATFLVLIILAFISFVIYRCEKNYMRRRFQDTFHVGPGGGGGGGPHCAALPSISVSVQTEPPLSGHLANGHADGIADTTILPVCNNPGGGGGGGGLASSSGNGVASGGGGTRSVFSHHHTLPHGSSAHHHRQLMSSSNYGILAAANGGANGELVGNGDLADMFPPPPLPARNGGLANGGGSSIWNTANIHAAQSYRDVRDVAAIALSQSRENTLSRDLVNHHSRDDGLMRSSCTQESLVSPSALLGSGRPSNPGAVTSAAAAISAAVMQQQQQQSGEHRLGLGEDDEIATEYAESDVLLGGPGSNGSSSGAGSAAANNISIRY